MEKFYFEEPNIGRKEDAVAYINEFYEYNSNINGAGGLRRYLEDYEGWLKKLEEDRVIIPDEEKVPAKTYFFIRENDKRIVGMITIRLVLNENLKKHGGHIGYSIRPTERKKGYNKINLYLGLKVCQSYGIDKVSLDANIDNPALWKTMEGGVNVGEYFDDEKHRVLQYEINVAESLRQYSPVYEPMIEHYPSQN